MCGSLTSSDSHGPSAHLYVFAKYIQSVDGGNLAPLLQRRFFTAPYPLLNIGIETFQKQICSNDGNLAPPQTEQLSMLKRGRGDASSSHRRCVLCRWCKISSIHSMCSPWIPRFITCVRNVSDILHISILLKLAFPVCPVKEFIKHAGKNSLRDVARALHRGPVISR